MICLYTLIMCVGIHTLISIRLCVYNVYMRGRRRHRHVALMSIYSVLCVWSREPADGLPEPVLPCVREPVLPCVFLCVCVCVYVCVCVRVPLSFLLRLSLYSCVYLCALLHYGDGRPPPLCCALPYTALTTTFPTPITPPPHPQPPQQPAGGGSGKGRKRGGGRQPNPYQKPYLEPRSKKGYAEGLGGGGGGGKKQKTK